MRQDQQRELDALHRVLDFLNTRIDILRMLWDSVARKQVEQAVAGIRDHITAQVSADLVLAGQNSRQTALAKELVRKHMAPIARFARAKLRGLPDFSTLRKSGNPARPKALVDHAFAMVKASAPYADAMTAAGFPPDSITQLTAAAEALEQATIKRNNTRVGRVQSTTNIRTMLDIGREGVITLDAVISKQFESDQAILDAWASASRIDAKPGAVRKSVAAPTPVPSATPVAQVPPHVGP